MSVNIKEAKQSSLLAIKDSNGNIVRVIAPNPTQIGLSESPVSLALTGNITLPIKDAKITNLASSKIYTKNADVIINVTNNTAIAPTIYLPNDPETGQIHIIKDNSGNANTYNITIKSIKTNIEIDNSASVAITTANGDVLLIWNGNQWITIGNAGAAAGGGGGGGGGSGDNEASYLVLTNTVSLSRERAFTVGTGLVGTDAGINSTYTLGINNNVVATISGSTFTGAALFNAGLSGSLTKLTGGTSYLIAGSNITIITASNGAITISSTASTTTRYTAADANTKLHWKFEESSSPWVNSGNAGTLDLPTATGTPRSVYGLFGKAVQYDSLSALKSVASSVGNPGGTTMSMSAWIYPISYGAGQKLIAVKSYRSDGTWNSPYISLYMSLDQGDGKVQFYIAISGALVGITSTLRDRAALHQWSLVSMTYDGSVFSGYLNGQLVGTNSTAGTIDYGPTSDGPWQIGGRTIGANTEFFDGIIDDLRVENVVRSQDYFRTLYLNGVGLF